jgi:hypothetical protein
MSDLASNDYVRLEGSERPAPKRATLLGPADETESFCATIILRRRIDGPPLPDFDYFVETSPNKRERLDADEFAEKYGAHPDDIKSVEQFAERAGLKVRKTSVARRTVVVFGTAAQFSRAFGVTFARYQTTVDRRGDKPLPRRVRTYRGRDGFINVPRHLAKTIVGVFGLDNRPIGHRAGNPGDPAETNTLTVQQVMQWYNFPNPGMAIANQTIGIISPTGGYGGYVQNDINQSFNVYNLIAPQVIPISVDSAANGTLETFTTMTAAAGQQLLNVSTTAGVLKNAWLQYTIAGVTYLGEVTAVTPTAVSLEIYDPVSQQLVMTGFPVDVPAFTTILFNLDGETNQDICISALAAQGASVAVYFTYDTQSGWVDLVNRVLEPEPGDFPPGVNPPSVLSASWIIGCGDDPDGLLYSGITVNTLQAMDAAFMDAAILQAGPTICIASGDLGSNCYVGAIANDPNAPNVFEGDGYAHVMYPASDPWVLSVGGTTIGQGSTNMGNVLVEYAWNDAFPNSSYPWGTSGGGVSDYFPLPSYQGHAGVPNSINLGYTPDPANVTVTPPAPFNATGRGVPDVAANASINSGYGGFYLGGTVDQEPGNGTSAAAPLWAGLIAVLNANAGYNIGFINPTLYALGSSAFNPISQLWPDPAYPQLAQCPADNSNNGIPGYPTGPGWDAVTGWGSPNGTAILTALEQLQKIYILGGYQSPDVIITDLATNMPVPIGGAPGGPWDTLLEPSTDYGFAANVHNDSATEVANVVVSFWAIPGGVGANGTAVGAPQTVSIPAYGTVTVQASAPFVSAPSGQHLCAVVSIYSPTTGCDTNAATPLQIPDPGYSETHACSAWRNTDSMVAPAMGNFKFPLGFGKLPLHLGEPIDLEIHSAHVPLAWHQSPAAKRIDDVLQAVGANNNLPTYLLPEFNRAFSALDLKTKVKATRGGAVEEREASTWRLKPDAKAERLSVEISGEVPEGVGNGDIVLVKVTANYPKMERRGPRAVDFLEVIHISDAGPHRDN